jgi:hypothetical protein
MAITLLAADHETNRPICRYRAPEDNVLDNAAIVHTDNPGAHIILLPDDSGPYGTPMWVYVPPEPTSIY